MKPDFEILRRNTPGCRPGYTHLNAAGASLPDQSVIEAVLAYNKLEAQLGGYEAARETSETLERFYPAVAELLNCEANEVAFLENATRAWQAVFYSFSFQPGDRIVTCETEYASNFIAYLQRKRREGVIIDVIPAQDDGDIDLSALDAAITDRTRLISMSHIPTSSGIVLPAEEVGAIAKKHGVPFLLDACQSVGQIPVDVKAIGCDMLSATGRKYLRAPRATGLLFVNRAMQKKLEPFVLDLHSAKWIDDDSYEVREDGRQFENWEQNIVGKRGMVQAIENANTIGLEVIHQKIREQANTLRAMLTDIRKITLLDLGKNKCGIVTFSVNGQDAIKVRDALYQRGIATASIAGWNSLIDTRRRNIPSLVRASVHYYTNDQDLLALTDALQDLR
ncbi:MAG: aminotransferase class V-fold PLP-dependent enzyme [Pseudomonadota bacterium]